MTMKKAFAFALALALLPVTASAQQTTQHDSLHLHLGGETNRIEMNGTNTAPGLIGRIGAGAQLGWLYGNVDFSAEIESARQAAGIQLCQNSVYTQSFDCGRPMAPANPGSEFRGSAGLITNLGIADHFFADFKVGALWWNQQHYVHGALWPGVMPQRLFGNEAEAAIRADGGKPAIGYGGWNLALFLGETYLHNVDSSRDNPAELAKLLAGLYQPSGIPILLPPRNNRADLYINTGLRGEYLTGYWRTPTKAYAAGLLVRGNSQLIWDRGGFGLDAGLSERSLMEFGLYFSNAELVFGGLYTAPISSHTDYGNGGCDTCIPGIASGSGNNLNLGQEQMTWRQGPHASSYLRLNLLFP